MNILGTEKLIYHADRLMDIKEKGDTYPVHMQIGLTEYCCHRCIFCHSEYATADTTKNNTIDKNALMRFLREAQQYGLKAVTLVGSGEPLLHPQAEQILKDINALGLQIGIFTNGSKISESLRRTILDTCTFVRFSVNASNEEEFEMVHRVKGDFQNVLNNITQMVEEKKQRKQALPTIGTQMVFYEDNYCSVEKAAKLWKKVGVDYFEIKPVIAGEGCEVNKTVFPAKDAEDVLKHMDLAKEYETSEYKVYAKYEQYETTQDRRTRNYKKCYKQALCMNLWADGNLYLCGNHETEKDVIGNIYEQSFIDIWNGEKRRKRVETIEVSKCPQACVGHFVNEYVHDFLHPNDLIHPNFI